MLYYIYKHTVHTKHTYTHFVVHFFPSFLCFSTDSHVESASRCAGSWSMAMLKSLIYPPKTCEFFHSVVYVFTRGYELRSDFGEVDI